MADAKGDSSSSKKSGEALEEYRESRLRRAGRGIKRFYTEESDIGGRVAGKISRASPRTFIGNLFRTIVLPIAAIFGVVLFIFVLVIGGVFGVRCAQAGTCSYAFSQVDKVFEKTGAKETIFDYGGRILNFAWTGGSSGFFNPESDVRESDVKKYIELVSPPDKVVFEQKPITIATSMSAYNLSEDTKVSLNCSLDGYSEGSKVTYSYQEKILAAAGEKRYSLVCTFEDGLKARSENTDFFDNRRGIMTLAYDSNAKSNWCLYVLHSSVVEDYLLKRQDPLAEIKRRDPECISGNNAGATIPEFVSAEQLVFGVLDDQPFSEGKSYHWQLKLTEPFGFDYKGSLGRLYNIYVYVPEPAYLVTEESSCQFEASSELEGYNYKLKKDALDFVNTDCSPITLKRTGIGVDECIQTFKEDISFGCPIKIQDTLSKTMVLPEKVIVKAYAQYSYELRESFNVVIKRVSSIPDRE